MRYSQDIFRSSYKLAIVFLTAFLLVAFSSNTSYALTPWFAIKDGGVLSGASGTGVTVTIPSSQLPPAFVSVLIQGAGVGSNPKPNMGSIVVRGDKSVKTGSLDTKDAYIKGIGVLPAVGFFSSLKQIAKPFTGNCQSMLTNSSLKPSDLVYLIDTSCLEDALDPLSGGYKLDADGVVIIYVTPTGSNTVLNIDNDVKPSNGKPNQRLMIVSEAKIEIGKDVGYTQGSVVPANYYSTTVPNIQASLVSLSADGIVIKSTSNLSTERALIMEGPVYTTQSITLKRELPLIAGFNFPGVYIRYNPFYVAKLMDQLQNSDLVMPGSGARWIYD